MEKGDAEPIARARAGDPEAYRTLVERHGRRVFRIAFRITGNETDAEDVVQETFLKAYRQLDRYQPQAGFGAWIGRIAANSAVDLLRGRKRRAKLAAAAAAPEGAARPAAVASAPDRAAYAAEIRGRVRHALERLTDSERASFVLRHFEERSIKEIAAALSQSEGATKQALFRAVRKLRSALAPAGAQGPTP